MMTPMSMTARTRVAEPTWGEAAAAAVVTFFTGVGATVKALKSKNGNGHHSEQWHGIDKRVGFLERDYLSIRETLTRHDTKLDDIREDLSKIMAAVDRRQS